MSGFLLFPNAHHDSMTEIETKYAASISAMMRKRLTRSRTIKAGESWLVLFANPNYDPADSIWEGEKGDLCTYTGTLLYQGKAGRAACESLHRAFVENGFTPPEDIYGNYCVLICHRESLYLFTDYAGLYHVYYTDDFHLVTNSFLGAAASLEKLEINEQEIYEYILHIACYSTKTYLKNITLYDPSSVLKVHANRTTFIRRPDLWALSEKTYARLSFEEHLEHAVEVGTRYFQQVASVFGDRVACGLSGGHDSRLILSFLRNAGLSPRLYVYGSDTSTDVVIAKQISEKLRLKIEHINRSEVPPLSVEDYWRDRDTVFHQMDGVSQYGFICNPLELESRYHRYEGGALVFNGGCGEIWRNFWYLPDRRYTAFDIVKSWHDRIPEDIPTQHFRKNEYYWTLAQKLASAAGFSDNPMIRAYTEAAYPKFRVRYWQGKNNSINAVLGKSLTPFAETFFTIPSMWIPIRYKKAGYFENQMTIRLSPELAKCPSAYGFTFYDGPPLSYKVKESLIHNIPILLRPHFRKRLYSRKGLPYYLSDKYVSAYFGKDDLEVSQYVNLAACDAEMYSRALTIERILRGNIL